jgi:hypothetical protein
VRTQNTLAMCLDSRGVFRRGFDVPEDNAKAEEISGRDPANLTLPCMVKGGGLRYTWAQVERFLAALATASEEVEVRYLWRPNLPVEGDNFISRDGLRSQRPDDRDS